MRNQPDVGMVQANEVHKQGRNHHRARLCVGVSGSEMTFPHHELERIRTTSPTLYSTLYMNNTL